MEWIVALVWLPFALALHTTLHEMSHWFVAHLHGVSGTISARPSRLPDGRFVWGYTRLNGPLPEKALSKFYVAPVVTSMVWLAMMCVAVQYAPLKLLFVELAAPVFDVAVWALGAWTLRSGVDAERFLAAGGMSKWTFRAGVSLLVAAMAVAAALAMMAAT